MSEINPNTQITGESQKNNNPVELISHDTPNSLGVSESAPSETNLQKIFDLVKESQNQIGLLQDRVSQLTSIQTYESERKRQHYYQLLASKYGSFGKLCGISLPTEILTNLQFISRINVTTNKFGRNYVLNELKLMTVGLNKATATASNFNSKIDQIFYLFFKLKNVVFYPTEDILYQIAENVYDLDISNANLKLEALQIIYSNPYFNDKDYNGFFLDISIDNRIQLLENQSKQIRSVDPYIIINSIIKSSAEVTAEYWKKRKVAKKAWTKLSYSLDMLTDVLSNQIFLIKDYDKLFNLLSYIAQEDSMFCKSIQKVIYLEKVSEVYFDDNDITKLLEKIANHILKTHNKNVDKMCHFLFYLNNLWVDIEGWWCNGDGAARSGGGPVWQLICQPELKQTVINILKNIKNVKEEYCAKEIDIICSSEAFDIKNWRQYVQFQDSKEDVVMKSETFNNIIWEDGSYSTYPNDLQSSEGKEKLANAILSDLVKEMDTMTRDQKDPHCIEITKSKCVVYQCDNADMMNDINQHINKLVRSCWKDDSYFQLKHYTCSDDWKKIHFNLYKIYTDPKIKKAYIDAANIN